MQKTKHQIIDETVAYFSEDTSRRAKQCGFCVYLTEDGRFCGHSMWIRPEIRKNIFDGVPDTTGYSSEDVISRFGDEVHVPEARGYEPEFWEDIQMLHDYDPYWDNKGLTMEGSIYVKILKQKYR